MSLAKVYFIFVLIPTLLQGRIAANKKSEKVTSTQASSISIWRRFDCRTTGDCPRSKYCSSWKCVPRHKGFCSNDSECLAREWCTIKHVCVEKTWCDATSDCGMEKCCAKIDPLAQGNCLPLIKPGHLCLIEIELCPCVKGYYCKPFSKKLGRCTKDQDIKI